MHVGNKWSSLPITVSMQSLVENMRVRNRSVQKRDRETILIEFDTKELPDEIFFGVMKYSVREFMPKPMSYICQEFGHTAKMCKGKRRCARCGGEHEYRKCGEEVRPKCCNCGGNHSVAYWGCEVLKKEVEVQKMKGKKKLSYADAVKLVQMKNQRKEAEYNKEQLAVVENQYKRKSG